MLNESKQLSRQWLLSLLLGSTLYAAYQGVMHFSDWCYLAASPARYCRLNKLLLLHLTWQH
jgi:hypothetical protein